LVIFSEATGVVREPVAVWVELYSGYVLESVIGVGGDVGGERSTIEEIQFSDLLSVIDRI
jgi:hypothetical protein